MPKKASSRARPQRTTAVLPWKRWVLYAILAAAGLFLGFLIPYAWYLDGVVRARFGELSWQVPTRVYARPLVVSPGLRMDAETLQLELRAAAYREEPGAATAGSYEREGGRFRIASRGYVDVDGRVPERRIELTLADGRVATLKDADSGETLRAARLDPARIATLYGQKQEERRLARLEDLPEQLIFALQAVEDRDFKHHRGIDFSGIARAFWANLREGEVVQGGSTLTQQLVRNLFLSREQTYWRKFNEALYSVLIEARFDKGRILEAYVNQVYLGQVGGQSVHGMVAGAEFWFGRDPQRLRSEEIAMLVGMIRGPSYYDPRRYPERAKARRDLVLGVMAETGVITEAERDAARARPLSITSSPGVAANRYPAFMDLVRRQLADDFPQDALRGAGLSVMTTLAPSAQTYAERAVATVLPEIERKEGPPLQTGLVVTDTHTGAVVAAIGNRRVDQPGFNRALEAQRPVGSLLKPFVYLLALVQPGRYSLATTVDDAPISLRLPNGQTWSPSNSDNRSHGPVRLIDALAQSYNQATVRVGLDVGQEGLAVLLQRLAGARAQPNPALILGAVDLSPFAMAQLYQFLASGGEVQTLKVVRGVLDAQNVALSRYDDAPPPATEGDAIAARLVTIALQSAVTSGTGRRLVADGLGRLSPAGKTGTTNDGRDSWFAGWSGDHLAVVWVGNDENQVAGLYGATGAMRVWSALFSKLPTSPLRVGGEGIEWAWVAQGEYATTDESCPGARRLPFVAGWTPRAHRGCTMDRIRDWFGAAPDTDDFDRSAYQRR
ncbi:penicillin-binding protein 1B [Coralloluteibacterium thermophilus]|uniref:Penicillin-binding protein 1B n=1 Tax=Coralloluteibacterium thermophilum TaxID=2707049 RepID=A0ABV9NIK3_9GAMM